MDIEANNAGCAKFLAVLCFLAAGIVIVLYFLFGGSPEDTTGILVTSGLLTGIGIISGFFGWLWGKQENSE